uniref:Uncharacterized protein n=1 Tax=Candidozyma auris TaxID=498019 RepID=A0A0L0NUG3_CANAR
MSRTLAFWLVDHQTLLLQRWEVLVVHRWGLVLSTVVASLGTASGGSAASGALEATSGLVLRSANLIGKDSVEIQKLLLLGCLGSLLLLSSALEVLLGVLLHLLASSPLVLGTLVRGSHGSLAAQLVLSKLQLVQVVLQ